MPFKKSQVNTNLAIYNSLLDLYLPRYSLPEVTIKGKTPRILPKRLKPYWVTSRTSLLNFGDVVKGINTATLGGLNNLSPTLWARRYYDTLSLVSGDTSWKDYTTNWMLGNNGVVSNKFAKEHPYWSMAINGVGDIAALGGISNASKIDKAIKYFPRAGKVTLNVAKTNSNPLNLRNYGFLKDSRFYSDLDNYGVNNILLDRELGNYPLTFTERRNYITDLKKDIQKGVDYAINEAKENVTTPLKGEYVESPLGFKFNLKKSKGILPLKMLFGTRQSTVKRSDKKTPWEGDYGAFRSSKGLFFPFRDRPNTLRTHSMFLDINERVGVGAHETRHTILSYFNTPLVEIRGDLPGTYGRYTNRKLPLNFREKVNSYINDAGTAGEWEGSLSEMDAELTGWGALYGIPSKYSQMTPQLKATVYDLFLKRFGGNTDYTLSNDVLGLFGSSLSKSENVSLFEKSIDNSKISEILKGLELLGYRKQGGILNFLKPRKGSTT